MTLRQLSLLSGLFLAACSLGQKPVAPVLGAVSSTDVQATEVGAQILQRGGNAVDAAVATALALVVVNPQAGNLGGGGFAVVRFAGQVTSLDFRETAPAAAHAEMYLDEQGNPIPHASTRGPLAAGVPGSPRGYYALHKKFGHLPWAQVVVPAVDLARQGLTITPRLYESIAWKREVLAAWPESARWLPEGQVPLTGTVVALPELAATLAQYAQAGPDGLDAVYRAVARASRKHGGILTVTDMTRYYPVWRTPVMFEAFEWRIAAMNLPSSGGILMGQTFGILERLDWHRRPPLQRTHLLIESWRRAYADRTLLADPARTEATAMDLLANSWLDRRAEHIDPDQATPSTQVTSWSADAVVGKESLETTHLSVLDAQGNAVAMTVTLNGTFGGGFYVPAAGFFLNNEMNDFTTAPGHPNMFGLVQGDANNVAPGARMLSSMTPTVAWRGDDVLVLGSPGGSRIPTATMQVFLNRQVLGWSLDQAVRLPRFHHQWLPDVVQMEDDVFDARGIHQLERLGHHLETTSWHIGEVNAVEQIAGHMDAMADPRAGNASAQVVRVRSASH